MISLLAMALSSALLIPSSTSPLNQPSILPVGNSSCSGIASTALVVRFDDGLEPSEVEFELAIEGRVKGSGSDRKWVWTIELEANEDVASAEKRANRPHNRRTRVSLTEAEATSVAAACFQRTNPAAHFGLPELPVGVSIKSWIGRMDFEFEHIADGTWSRSLHVLGRRLKEKSQVELAMALMQLQRQIPRS